METIAEAIQTLDRMDERLKKCHTYLEKTEEEATSERDRADRAELLAASVKKKMAHLVEELRAAKPNVHDSGFEAGYKQGQRNTAVELEALLNTLE